MISIGKIKKLIKDLNESPEFKKRYDGVVLQINLNTIEKANNEIETIFKRYSNERSTKK